MANRLSIEGVTGKTFDLGLVDRQILDATGLTDDRTFVMQDISGNPTQTPTHIATGDTFVVDVDKQLLIAEPMTIDGTLTIDGTVIYVTPSTTGVTPGSYTLMNATVDSLGRITAASSTSALPAAGSNSQIQYNSGGVFAATDELTFSSSAGSCFETLGNNTSTTQSEIVLQTTGSQLTIQSQASGSNRFQSSGLMQFLHGGFEFGALVTNTLVKINAYVGTTTVDIDSDTGILSFRVAGSGLAITSGTDCKQDVVTLSGGIYTVTNAAVTANSRIYVTIQDPNGGTPGALYLSGITAGTGFTINSTSGADTSIVAYHIIEAI